MKMNHSRIDKSNFIAIPRGMRAAGRSMAEGIHITKDPTGQVRLSIPADWREEVSRGTVYADVYVALDRTSILVELGTVQGSNSRIVSGSGGSVSITPLLAFVRGTWPDDRYHLPLVEVGEHGRSAVFALPKFMHANQGDQQ